MKVFLKNKTHYGACLAGVIKRHQTLIKFHDANLHKIIKRKERFADKKLLKQRQNSEWLTAIKRINCMFG